MKVKKKFLLFVTTALLIPFGKTHGISPVAYDIDEAREMCLEMPLEEVEGIWLYPEDNVTVLILNDGNEIGSSLPGYTISVVESSDSRLNPGDVIGHLRASADSRTFGIELLTESKNGLLLKPQSCTATLSSDGETFIIKKKKGGLKSRLNLNLNRLLPGFWKIVSFGVSKNNSNGVEGPPVGMIKIFPSYDGNGSSRRKIRYL